MPNKSKAQQKGKKKKAANRQRANNAVQPRAKSVVTMSRGPASSSSLGTLVGKAVNIAERIPVLGNVVEKVDSVASSILSFLGVGSSLFSAHYDVQGKLKLIPHRSVEKSQDEKAIMLTAGETIPPGTIVMKYAISIGPEGSRSRAMGQLYEKVTYHGFQLSVNANCAATTSGSLAYLYVPDPSDTTLDTMADSERLSALCSRENVQFAQVWQSSLLNFRIPPKEYYVKFADGVERFTSPGTVYVVTMTAVSSDVLPTLRQTSAFTFTKPTNVPTTQSPEMAIINASSKTSADSTPHNEFWLGHFGTMGVVTRWEASRILSTQYYSETTSTWVIHNTIKVFKGEMMTVIVPLRVSSGNLSLCRLVYPAWMFASVLSKPGDPRQWLNQFDHATPDANYPYVIANDNIIAGNLVYRQVATEDIEVVFVGGTPSNTTETNDGSFVVMITNSGNVDEYTLDDLRLIRVVDKRATLSKSVAARRLPAPIMVDEPVMVPRASVPATPLRR